MKLALFDLDNTLLAGDSDHAWGEFLCAQNVVDSHTYAAQNAQFYADYQAGTLDIHAFCEFVFQPFITVPKAHLLTLRTQYIQEVVVPMVAKHSMALLQKHRELGHTLCIITAPNNFVVEPIAQLLGVPHLIATEVEELEGVYTGKVAGIPCFQHGKIEKLEQWLSGNQFHPEETWFYSDSRNDIPLLSVADHAIAVDPDDTLRTHAQQQGWEVISLR